MKPGDDPIELHWRPSHSVRATARVLPRRKFLALTGSALAAAGLAPIAAADTQPSRKMTIDLTWGAVGVRANQLQAIDLAQQYGFESVAADAGFLTSLSEENLHDLLADMKQKKLVWGAAGVPVDFRGTDESFERDIKQFPKTAAALERAGVTRMGTWLSPSHAQLTYIRNFRQHAKRLREIARILGDHGLRLGLEYVGPKTSWTRQRYPFIHTMAETKDLISEIGMNNVGFVLDSWHWYTAGDTVEDLLSLTNADIIAVDLNDAPSGIPVDQQIDSRRELPCATGVIDVAVFLNTLAKLRYDGPVRAEPFNKTLNELDNDDACAATAAAMKKAFALIN